MSMDTAMNSPGAQATLRQQAASFWRARTPRERQAVVLVALAVLLLLIWSMLVAPAMRAIREAPAQLDQLEAQTQQMQRAANEVETLRGATRVAPAQAMAALKTATDRLGANAKLVVQGERATLTISGNGVNSTALRAWLTEARSGARARPIEAQLQRGTAGYTGTLGVVLGSGG